MVCYVITFLKHTTSWKHLLFLYVSLQNKNKALSHGKGYFILKYLLWIELRVSLPCFELCLIAGLI